MYWVIISEFILNQLMVVYAVVLLCLFLAAVIPFISLVVHLDCVWFSF